MSGIACWTESAVRFKRTVLDELPVRFTTSSANASIRIGSIPPMLIGFDRLPSVPIIRTNASTASSMYRKQRVCVPLPRIVMFSP